MCSMNGNYFVILTQGNLLLIFSKMKIQSRTLWICCHLCFASCKKKIGSLYPPTRYNSLPFLKCFYNWGVFFSSCVFVAFVLSFKVLNLRLDFMFLFIHYGFYFCLIYAFTNYVMLFYFMFLLLGLRFYFRFWV